MFPEENVVIKINTLTDFENHALALNVDTVETNRLLNKLVKLQSELQLKAVRPIESGADDDWIMFIPEIIYENTPVKIAAILVYRFGFIKDIPAESDSNFTVGNLGLVSEHSIADGDESIAAELFLKGKAKFILANADFNFAWYG